MAEQLATFQAFGSHNGLNQSMGPFLTGSISFTALAINDGSGISDPFPQPVIPFSAYTLEDDGVGRSALAKSFIGSITNDGTSGVQAAIANGDESWHVQGVYADNSNSQSLGKASPATSSTVVYGRNAPPQVLRLGGAALTAFQDTGAVLTANGTYTYQYDEADQYQTLVQWAEFENDPPDSETDGTEVVTRLAQALAYPTNPYVLGTASTGVDIVANDCQFAAVGPDCRIFIEAGDQGNLAEQIPAGVEDNMALHFRFHPTVFMRRTNYVRSVHRVYRDPLTINVTQNGQPIRITTVTTQPTESFWLIIVDGVPQIVAINHGVADLRRPRDIWNQLWVPLIHSDQSVGTCPLLEVAPDTGLRGPGISELRLKFLDYARYISTSGTDIVQQNTLPN